MIDKRVLRNRIGAMPPKAEIALANLLLARRMRHVARCNCGAGYPQIGCTTSRTISEDDILTIEEIEILNTTAQRARERANSYRKNRTWKFGGNRPAYNYKDERNGDNE